MSELPNVSPRQAVSAFAKFGFVLVRTHGSHAILKKEEYKFLLSVPQHGGKNLKTGTLRSLIRAAGITVEEFRAVIK